MANGEMVYCYVYVDEPKQPSPNFCNMSVKWKDKFIVTSAINDISDAARYRLSPTQIIWQPMATEKCQALFA